MTIWKTALTSSLWGKAGLNQSLFLPISVTTDE